MRRIRVIPILLLSNGGLVKTVKFRHPNYIGDPINAVKIFNDKEVDELVLLDIEKSKKKQLPDYAQIRDIVSEAFMPLAYGGGIQHIDHIKKVIDCGVEKVVLNTSAFTHPRMIDEAAKVYGSQSVVIAVDVKKDWLGNYHPMVLNGSARVNIKLADYIKKVQNAGAGEIVLTSINREGTFAGYDVQLISEVNDVCNVPLVANGGARGVDDFLNAIKAGASAVAAGSRFVYTGREHGILINYPSQEVLKKKLYQKLIEQRLTPDQE